MLVHHHAVCSSRNSSTQREENRAGSAISAGSVLARVMRNMVAPCFERVAVHTEDMQACDGNDKRLSQVMPQKKESDLDHPLLHALSDDCLPEVARLLESGIKTDITPFFKSPGFQSMSLDVLELLAKHNALPSGVTLATVKFMLYVFGHPKVARTSMLDDNVNFNGIPGVKSPMEFFAPEGNVAMVCYLIYKDASQRPLEKTLWAINNESFYINGHKADKAKAIVARACNKYDDRFRVTEKLLSNPSEELDKCIQHEKSSWDGREGTLFLPFFCWAAKNNRADLFEKKSFSDIFSYFTRAASYAAEVAGGFGCADFFIAALERGLLDSEAARSASIVAVTHGEVKFIAKLLTWQQTLATSQRPGLCFGSRASKHLNLDLSELVFVAIRTQQMGALKLLISEGAPSENLTRTSGHNGLQTSIFRHNVEATKFFLNRNPDLDYRDDYGNTAYDIAVENDFKAGIDLLDAWSAQKSKTKT